MCVMLGGMPTAQLAPSDQPALRLLTDCTPVVRQVIKPDEAATAVGFKALSDPARPADLAGRSSRGPGGACVCDLTEPVGLSQPDLTPSQAAGGGRHPDPRTTREMGLLQARSGHL